MENIFSGVLTEHDINICRNGGRRCPQMVACKGIEGIEYKGGRMPRSVRLDLGRARDRIRGSCSRWQSTDMRLRGTLPCGSDGMEEPRGFG